MQTELGLEPIRTVLPNGLTLIVHESHVVPTVAVSGSLKAGALLDTPTECGLASMTAHMLRRGTECSTALQIAEKLDTMGASLSIDAGTTQTAFHVSCLSHHLSSCFEILAEVLIQPIFPEDEVEKLKSQTVAALREDETQPGEVVWRKFRQLIYPEGHPLRYDSSGEPDTVAALFRDKMASRHKEHFVPQNMIVVVVGDVDAPAIVDLVGALLGEWTAENDDGDYSIADVPLPKAGSREATSLLGRTQTEIFIGHRGLRRSDPRFYAGNVLTTILGGPWGRMFNEIRDNRGLAYSVGCNLSAGVGEGPFSVNMGVNPNDVEQAIESARGELQNVRENIPSDEEVEDARNYILGRYLMSMETHAGIASAIHLAEFFGLGIDYVRRVHEFYESVSAASVLETARELIQPDHLAIAIAGP